MPAPFEEFEQRGKLNSNDYSWKIPEFKLIKAYGNEMAGQAVHGEGRSRDQRRGGGQAGGRRTDRRTR